MQRSHLVTGDEGHYAGVVMDMEARGAKVNAVQGSWEVDWVQRAFRSCSLQCLRCLLSARPFLCFTSTTADFQVVYAETCHFAVLC